MRGKVKLFGKTLPAWAVAAALVIATSGAATGVVLAGQVTGTITTTSSQAMVINDAGTEIASGTADKGIVTISDDGTQFHAGAEVNTGDDYEVNVSLSNLSNDELSGELSLVGPEGITLSVDKDGSGDVVEDVVQTGPFNWKFRLKSDDAGSSTSTDMVITVALADDLPPGFYAIDGKLKQVAK